MVKDEAVQHNGVLLDHVVVWAGKYQIKRTTLSVSSSFDELHELVSVDNIGKRTAGGAVGITHVDVEITTDKILAR